MTFFLVPKDRCFFCPCDTFPTWPFWPFICSHRIFVLLHASSSWASSLYFFFMGLIAVLLFLWYISYITYLIHLFSFLFLFFWHFYCLLDDILSCSERPMFFCPCDTFPTRPFWPFICSHRIFVLLHASSSWASSLYYYSCATFTTYLISFVISVFPISFLLTY